MIRRQKKDAGLLNIQEQLDDLNSVEEIRDYNMKKLISFKVLKSVCCYEYQDANINPICDHINGNASRCNSKNCPVWKKLKDVKK